MFWKYVKIRLQCAHLHCQQPLIIPGYSLLSSVSTAPVSQQKPPTIFHQILLSDSCESASWELIFIFNLVFQNFLFILFKFGIVKAAEGIRNASFW